MKKFRVILIGAGQRGKTYTDYMKDFPAQFELVAVAEPLPGRRNAIREAHHLPESACYTDWRDLLSQPKMADLAIIATQDREHFDPAMQAIRQKYDLLLEKPIAPTPEECLQISRAAEQNGVRVVVCFVLRFTPFFRTLAEWIDSGRLGEVVSISHYEGVGNVHQSHSFVRGNWHREADSAPMLLAKSCHDMDLLQWLIGKRCTAVQSFGTRSYFNAEHRPMGAPNRCIEGCPHAETCPYDAVKLYLQDEKNDWFRTAATNLPSPTNADVEAALRAGPYGICVFACDNDVVDHQTVNLSFEGGVTATFTMSAFSKGGRRIHVMGTKGEISGWMESGELTHYDFLTRETEIIRIQEDASDPHGGGDSGIMHELYRFLSEETLGRGMSPIAVTAENHLLCFAAEKSRHTGTVVDFQQYVDSLKK